MKGLSSISIIGLIILSAIVVFALAYVIKTYVFDTSNNMDTIMEDKEQYIKDNLPALPGIVITAPFLFLYRRKGSGYLNILFYLALGFFVVGLVVAFVYVVSNENDVADSIPSQDINPSKNIECSQKCITSSDYDSCVQNCIGESDEKTSG